MALFDIPDIIVTGSIYTFFVPFLILFCIFWGVLSAMRIFNKKVNLVLSIVITIGLSATDLFTYISTYLLSLGATFTVAAFFLIFFFGIIMWTFGKGKQIYRGAMAPADRLKNIDKEIAKVDKEIMKAKRRGKSKETMALFQTRDSLIRERWMAELELREKMR